MKVLSIKEPFASLIKNKKKYIETRSWKTNYRGELYIHASLSKVKKEDINNPKLLSLLENIEYKYGHIICNCNLVDCIYMNEDYIENIKNNNYEEYICGNYKVGRYAWILENIVPLKTPIYAKGKLNIWTYKGEVK